MKQTSLPTVVGLAQMLHTRNLREGDCAIDATVGRGNDTVWLAECVGPSGLVIGFDIQAEAIESTHERLARLGLIDSVALHFAGHETLTETVQAFRQIPPIKSIVFNLGYLPSGEHRMITKPGSTVSALSQAAGLLATGGLLTVAVYPGHPGGAEESDAVEEWSDDLDPIEMDLASFRPLRTLRPSPWLLMISKR